MGRLIVTEFMSLDGVVEDPGGAESFDRGGWAFKFDRGDAGNRFKYEELMAADAQLLGRVTYNGFAQAWPKRNDDAFARKFNEMPKHVVTSSALDPEWGNSTRLEGDLAAGVSALKQQYGRDILVAGSVSLVQSLTALGLVDEYRLMVFPVVLGAGKRLFAGGAEHALRLTDTERTGDCVTLTLAPATDA